MWLIVGLGNPGTRYAQTRHNLGFMVIDRMARDVGVCVDRAICQAVVGQTQAEGQTALLAKPQTYMNRSGRAVSCLIKSHGLLPNQILVIVDDFALPLGRLRLRWRGSDGGHNGLKSIIGSLGTDDFPRLRLGIGPEPDRLEDPVGFVLSAFTREERESVELMIDRAQDAIRAILREGFEKAMTKFN